MFFNKPKLFIAAQAQCKGYMGINNGSKSINTFVFRQGIYGIKLLQNYVENRGETSKERASSLPKASMATLKHQSAGLMRESAEVGQGLSNDLDEAQGEQSKGLYP